MQIYCKHTFVYLFAKTYVYLKKKKTESYVITVIYWDGYLPCMQVQMQVQVYSALNFKLY